MFSGGDGIFIPGIGEGVGDGADGDGVQNCGKISYVIYKHPMGGRRKHYPEVVLNGGLFSSQGALRALQRLGRAGGVCPWVR